MLHKFRHLLWVVLAAVLLAGCGMRLAYDRVDLLIAWRADDFLDLSSAQREFLLQRVRYHQDWHRTKELVRYQVFLDGVEQRLENGLDDKEVDWFFEQLHGFKATLMETISADMAALLRTVTDEQKAYLKQAFVRSNDELEERLALSDEQRVRLRAKEAISAVERWTGRLDRAQREAITREIAALPDMNAPWLEYTRERQQQFLVLLEESPSDKNFDEHLRNWLLERVSARFADYQQHVKRAVLKIDQLITPTQRQHAIDELRDLREMLDGLRDV